MTWLPISVKNAAKCDKWYVLQNHPITESLNAKGAREKPLVGDPRACRKLSVEKTNFRQRGVWAPGGFVHRSLARPRDYSKLWRRFLGGRNLGLLGVSL